MVAEFLAQNESPGLKMNTESAAYKCKVFRPNTKAWLQLGNRRRFVEVIEQSRESFTVRTTSKIAAKIKVGGKFRLHYQEMLWSVGCKNKWLNNEGGIDIEVEPLKELTPPKIVQGGILQRSSNVSTSGPMDGTLAFFLIALIIVGVLILPAWGGQWGTSQLICDGVSTVWKTLASIVTGRSY
jgi:hypothetical protein